jgi:predicted O-methyltransferase YrrM
LQLAELVKRLRPQALLEIGTALGGTLFLWCRLASDDATIISVDLPEGRFGGGSPEWRIPFYMRMTRRKQQLVLLRENSHDRLTLGKVMESLNGRQLDFLFIDGDHSFEGVKADFEMYSELVRSGGLIAFHDIVPHPKEADCVVSEFWDEVKVAYQHEEIVESYSQGWGGLGILFV